MPIIFGHLQDNWAKDSSFVQESNCPKGVHSCSRGSHVAGTTLVVANTTLAKTRLVGSAFQVKVGFWMVKISCGQRSTQEENV